MELESSTQIVDSEGYSSNGIVHGDISLVVDPNGYVGNAIDTGDPSGYIEIEDSQNVYDFSSENAFTLEAWVKKQDFSDGGRIITKENSEGNSHNLFCRLTILME